MRAWSAAKSGLAPLFLAFYGIDGAGLPAPAHLSLWCVFFVFFVFPIDVVDID